MSQSFDVHIRIDEALGLATSTRVAEGSTIADVKAALAREDPTGSTCAEGLVLARVGSEQPLEDDVRIDESLLQLAVCTAPPTAMQHVLARTKPAELADLRMAREVYAIINCAEQNGLDYEEYEDYLAALEEYWSDAVMDEDAPDPVPDIGTCFDEVKFNEQRVFKARGELLEAQQRELSCKQYLELLAEIAEHPWIPGVGVFREDQGGIEEGEDGVRKAMKTGYVSNLMLSGPDLDKYVDVRKIWCLSEPAARIGQARKELIESVLTAHAADVSAGGRGILAEGFLPGRRMELSLEDVRQELDRAYEAKFQECREQLPLLKEAVAAAQRVCEERERDLDKSHQEREAPAEAAGQRPAEELGHHKQEKEEQEEQRRQEERKRTEAAAEAERKAVLDAERRRCFLERYGGGGAR